VRVREIQQFAQRRLEEEGEGSADEFESINVVTHRLEDVGEVAFAHAE
jgi:hypothetical protein